MLLITVIVFLPFAVFRIWKFVFAPITLPTLPTLHRYTWMHTSIFTKSLATILPSQSPLTIYHYHYNVRLLFIYKFSHKTFVSSLSAFLYISIFILHICILVEQTNLVCARLSMYVYIMCESHTYACRSVVLHMFAFVLRWLK